MNSDNPLFLPEGSVRAILAIMLIGGTLFATLVGTAAQGASEVLLYPHRRCPGSLFQRPGQNRQRAGWIVMFSWHWHQWPLEWPEHEDLADLYWEDVEYV